ncbi:MAG: hypothetical protein IKJ01_01345 [Lachnospiraceae bacterium]|nr:hypothetical protein [Lachnospiraceae bacterium]
MYPNAEFETMLNKMQSDSNKNTNVEVNQDSKVITLSTCVNNDAKRFVIHAVLSDRYPTT